MVAADVSQDELEELQRLVGQEEKARLAKSAVPHTAHFSGSAHFYEQVEDTKDSVWLVQVVPASGLGEPLLDDYRWQVVRHYLAPFAIQTGLFDCRLDRRFLLCSHLSEIQLGFEKKIIAVFLVINKCGIFYSFYQNG